MSTRRGPLLSITLVVLLGGCKAGLVESGELEAVRARLARGDDPNTPDRRGRTPLDLAISQTRVDLVEALLEAGADPNLRNVQGTAWGVTSHVTPLNRAITTLVGESSNNSLDEPAQARLAAIIEHLLRAGADVELGDLDVSTEGTAAFPGPAPLMNAAICHALARSDPEAPSGAARTRLCSELIDRLLELGADPSAALPGLFALRNGDGPRTRATMIRLLAAGAEYPVEPIGPPPARQSKTADPDAPVNYEAGLLLRHTPRSPGLVRKLYFALESAVFHDDEAAIIRLLYEIELILELGEDPVYVARRLAPAVLDWAFTEDPRWSAIATGRALLALGLPGTCTLPWVSLPLTTQERQAGVELTLSEAIARAEAKAIEHNVFIPPAAAARILAAGSRGAFVRTDSGLELVGPLI